MEQRALTEQSILMTTMHASAHAAARSFPWLVHLCPEYSRMHSIPAFLGCFISFRGLSCCMTVQVLLALLIDTAACSVQSGRCMSLVGLYPRISDLSASLKPPWQNGRPTHGHHNCLAVADHLHLPSITSEVQT